MQFQPPAGVQPGMVGTIIDETANPIDVSATIIDLAVRGYLTIEEDAGSGVFSRTDWTLTRQPDARSTTGCCPTSASSSTGSSAAAATSSRCPS